ncbi:hypothetical protein WMY93_031768 [Mugilogobius chulae]|uniref:Uncharacterized protein n=1 Tax=Mugilogobius chulae TaxID=88201 RepID=A0AAW0MCX1_9GOBI
MFRPERNSSPFSFMDMDMWDTNLTAQSSSWCGMATVSGSGYLSKVNTSSSGGAGSFRQTDPGLRKWQSLSHLAPNSDLRSGRGQSPFRQTGVMQWLQEAQERMDSHVDLLRTEHRPFSANLLDMKPRERPTFNTDLFKLKEALKVAESRAKQKEEECEQTIQKLQTATQSHKTLLSQTTELNQRLTETLQNLTEVQDQLREANNKISHSCLEKATLSTQILKLENTVRELSIKLKAAEHDKDDLTQENTDLQERVNCLEIQLETINKSIESLMLQNGLDHTETNDQEMIKLKQEVAALRQTNEDLTNELEEIEQTLKRSQAEVVELEKEKASKSQQIEDLETKYAELSSRSGQESFEELEEQIKQLRESSQFEKQRQHDHCLLLETAEKYRQIDAGRVQHIEELKVTVCHWTDKWQKAALTLQSAEAELEELRRKNKLELNACKQELELVKSRSQLEIKTAGCDEAGEDCTNVHSCELKESEKKEIQLEQKTKQEHTLWKKLDQHQSQMQRSDWLCLGVNAEKWVGINKQNTTKESGQHDRWSWHQGPGLMPVFEEEEPGDEEQEKRYNNPVVLRTKLTTVLGYTDVTDLKNPLPLVCPDGIFHVEVVDICSPDEAELD